MKQSKVLARELESNRYCDSVLLRTYKQVDTFGRLLTTQDSCVEVLELKIANQQKMMDNQDRYADAITDDLQRAMKQVHSQRWQKEFFIMSTFIFGSLFTIQSTK
jgi:hypothetical protein